MTAHDLPAEESARLTRLATSLSVATAAVLTLGKATVWLASDSVSIMASLADSGLDLVAALGAFWAVRYAAAPPDREHRYGHGKAEAFASLVQAGLVFASASVIGEEAVRHMLRPHTLAHADWGMAVMAFSTALTLALVAFQTRVLRKTHSLAVTGDRTHYLADAASNIVALLAVGAASFLHIGGIDAAGGLIVAAVLLWGAVDVFRKASDELLDRELPGSARTLIKELMTADPRVKDVHQLRTRASGPFVHIQMHADLDPELSLESAHQVVVAAEKRVLDAFPAADIIIHADPRGRAEPHGGAFAEEAERHEPVG